MKQSPELAQIQANMMPGALSAHGFIGEDSRNLIDIIQSDLEALQQLGITQEALADKMQEITDIGAKGLGRPESMDEHFEIAVEDYKGEIPCPFKDKAKANKRQTHVRRLDTGATIRWTDLNIHMIREHGFFEGYGSPYRLAPAELVKFLGMV
ncbi:MAG TPA: hypothetical protein PKU80_09100 [Candidatus Limiplasma sp.]|nr:hypothetical protein [Candidatus Limiplasma sp.]HRX08756.1 hypothetical protein [Candidatus Limiplasma sp.]